MCEVALGGSTALAFGELPVWPDRVGPVHLDPKLSLFCFPDNDEIRRVLEPRLLERERQFRIEEPDRWIGGGGAKIRDIADWDCPALALLHARARRAFRLLTGARSAFIDDCWANVYRENEFIGPHAHRRTEVSVVYHLTPPDAEEAMRFNGALCICDPRVERCCPTERGLVTSQVYPPLNPGTMVLFPSYVTHSVTPHIGEAHRISIAWNIDRRRIPGRPSDRPLL